MTHLIQYTVMCQVVGHGTDVWYKTLLATDVEDAQIKARVLCTDDWCYDETYVAYVIAVIEGEPNILFSCGD
jgi:hypothetical protein